MEQLGFEQAIKYAIGKEKEAQQLYARMANMSDDPVAKSFFVEMSHEEEKHEHMLITLKEKGVGSGIEFKQPLDMQIVDYLKPAKFAEDMGYKDALVFAANREKEAAAYYEHMAAVVNDETAQELFTNLSKWEMGHKAKIEAEYEKHFMQEN